MKKRVHEALDGELAGPALTPAEMAEREELAELITAVVASVPARPLPDLGAAVLERIAAGETVAARVPTAIERAFAWFWRPRSFVLQWRPAYGALAIVAGLGFGATVRQDVGAAGASTGPVLVQFRLDAPQAESVSLAGDFTGWKPVHAMIRSGDSWTVVIPLEPGVHDYAFVVDGERWVSDPMAAPVDDGFGGTNSRLAILAAAS